MFHYFPKCLSIFVLAAAFGCASAPSQQAGEPQQSVQPVTPATESPSPDSESLHNTLKWSTASEVENFGFDIYRSTSEDGPFERMTQEPIPGAGTIDEPQRYVWEDTSITPDVTYYYYIESISYAGVRERFSPIIKAPAKHRS